MDRLTIIFLLLSNCCCLLFSSCKISKYQSAIKPITGTLTNQNIFPVVDPKGTSSKFKANIDVLNKHFTGLVVVKKTDSITTHIVFVTELGMKMFDLEQKDTSFNVAYVFEPLNKPKLIAALKSNFKNMLLLNIYGAEVNKGVMSTDQHIFELKENKNKRYFVVDNTTHLTTQATFHKKKRASKITYTILPEIGYSQIKSIQFGLVKIKIELNRITD